MNPKLDKRMEEILMNEELSSEAKRDMMIFELENIIKFFKEENDNPKTRSRINSIVITNLELGWLWAKHGTKAERIGK